MTLTGRIICYRQGRRHVAAPAGQLATRGLQANRLQDVRYFAQYRPWRSTDTKSSRAIAGRGIRSARGELHNSMQAETQRRRDTFPIAPAVPPEATSWPKAAAALGLGAVQLLLPRASRTLGALRTFSSMTPGGSAQQRLLTALQPCPAASSTKARNRRGTVEVSQPLHAAPKLLAGSQGNAGMVPASVAMCLVGAQVGSFGALRQRLWRQVAASAYGAKFGAADQARMQQGRAPLAHPGQRVGLRGSYELHHLLPICQGGAVYDLANLAIVTPRYHAEILAPEYHYKPRRGSRQPGPSQHKPATQLE